MNPCPFNRHEYKMFRSLCDMINYQLRGKQAPQTPTKETLENIHQIMVKISPNLRRRWKISPKLLKMHLKVFHLSKPLLLRFQLLKRSLSTKLRLQTFRKNSQELNKKALTKCISLRKWQMIHTILLSSILQSRTKLYLHVVGPLHLILTLHMLKKHRLLMTLKQGSNLKLNRPMNQNRSIW